MKLPYSWDNYSDQPYQLKDKNYKKTMRKKEFKSILKTILISLFILPLSILAMPFVKRKEIKSNEFFCIGADYQREPNLSIELLEELHVERVLLRFKLWEMDTLNDLKDFILKLENKKITLKILQDRENVEDLNLLQRNLETIFSELSLHVDIFEIGSTINRAKWGFFSVDEYNKFFQVAYDLKTTK